MRVSVLAPLGDEPAGESAGVVREDGPIVVVTAMSMSKAARASLADRMGPGHVVRGIREAGNVADIVLVPAASTQLIGALRAMFPGAKILITELTDDEFGLTYGGPLQRALDSGVDGYFIAPDLDRVAEVAREVGAGRAAAALTAGPGQRAPIIEARRTGGVHLVAGFDDAAAQDLADRLGAVRLDPSDWSRRLFGPGADPDDLTVLADVVWEIAEQILRGGGSVLLADDPIWVERAQASEQSILHHDPAHPRTV